MLRIPMPSGIIKGSPTSCCSVGSRKLVGTGLCNVARGWVGSCVITIERPHDLAGKSPTIPVTLRLAAPMPRLIDDDESQQIYESGAVDLRRAIGWF